MWLSKLVKQFPYFLIFSLSGTVLFTEYLNSEHQAPIEIYLSPNPAHQNSSLSYLPYSLNYFKSVISLNCTVLCLCIIMNFKEVKNLKTVRLS